MKKNIKIETIIEYGEDDLKDIIIKEIENKVYCWMETQYLISTGNGEYSNNE
ncbi:hypothetical protein D3C86_2146160 [compost metagenome]